jgi:hypothetical protein
MRDLLICYPLTLSAESYSPVHLLHYGFQFAIDRQAFDRRGRYARTSVRRMVRIVQLFHPILLVDKSLPEPPIQLPHVNERIIGGNLAALSFVQDPISALRLDCQATDQRSG